MLGNVNLIEGGSNEKQWIWKIGQCEEMSSKAIYEAMLSTDRDESGSKENWEWVWKISAYHKIRIFFWKLLHKAIPVKDQLSCRGMQLEPNRPICANEPETIEHLLRRCGAVKEIWRKQKGRQWNQTELDMDITDWLRENAKLRKSSDKSTFAFSIWSIWCKRNNIMYQCHSGKEDWVPIFGRNDL